MREATVGETTPAAFDASVLRDWAGRAVRTLDDHRGELDALNVFPVADSDTGTNLYLTLREGLDALIRDRAGLGGQQAVRDREVARDFARGALVGARGNSGVIVSQYIGALLRTLETGPDVTPELFCRALRTATEAAYRAVAHPVEGTVLTVARAVGEGALEASRRAAGLRAAGLRALDVLEAGIDRGYVALAQTTAQLAALRAAGVLDAGAWGLLLVLDALADALHGPGARTPRARPAMPVRRDPVGTCATEGPGGEFEVMYLVVGDEGSGPTDDGVVAEALRAGLSAVGDSVAVVGGDGLWQAHVHTDTPLRAVDAARAADVEATQIRVRHLASQSGVHGTHRPPLGLVTVTGAPGLTADLARAGAVVVLVPPGGAAGPELERAIDDTGAATVLVLAADGLLTGAPARPGVRVADHLSEAQVVAGAATLASLDPRLGADGLADAVLRAVLGVRTAAVPGVGPGEHADRAVQAARTLLSQQTTLLTVLTSAATPAGVVDRVRAEVEGTPVEVVVLPTGAPGDQVVLGAE